MTSRQNQINHTLTKYICCNEAGHWLEHATLNSIFCNVVHPMYIHTVRVYIIYTHTHTMYLEFKNETLFYKLQQWNSVFILIITNEKKQTQCLIVIHHFSHCNSIFMIISLSFNMAKFVSKPR